VDCCAKENSKQKTMKSHKIIPQFDLPKMADTFNLAGEVAIQHVATLPELPAMKTPDLFGNNVRGFKLLITFKRHKSFSPGAKLLVPFDENKYFTGEETLRMLRGYEGKRNASACAITSGNGVEEILTLKDLEAIYG
jgi:hypothetical protein